MHAGASVVMAVQSPISWSRASFSRRVVHHVSLSGKDEVSSVEALADGSIKYKSPHATDLSFGKDET